MEHGMLSPESAKRAFEKKQRKQKELRIGTPVKPSKSATKTETSNKQQASKNGDIKAKKVIVESDEEEDDFISPKRRKGQYDGKSYISYDSFSTLFNRKIEKCEDRNQNET